MKVNLIFLLTLAAFVFSCNKEEEPLPAPEFTILDAYYAIDEPVQIREVSQAESYFWDFGNGETSTDQTPNNVMYTEPGIYTITLRTRTSGRESSVEQEVKIGQYFAYEVQLLSYIENYALEGGDVSAPSEGEPDVYLKIVSYVDGTNDEVLYESEVQPGVSREDLPMRWKLDGIALGGNGLDPYFSPMIKFYDHNEDKDDRLIAWNLVTGGGMKVMYDKEQNEGEYSVQRGSDDWGSHIIVKFRLEFPNR